MGKTLILKKKIPNKATGKTLILKKREVLKGKPNRKRLA